MLSELSLKIITVIGQWERFRISSAKMTSIYLISFWIYNKINEVDGNGGKGDFTDEEKQQLKEALYDFADRIRKTADKFK